MLTCYFWNYIITQPTSCSSLVPPLRLQTRQNPSSQGFRDAWFAGHSLCLELLRARQLLPGLSIDPAEDAPETAPAGHVGNLWSVSPPLGSGRAENALVPSTELIVTHSLYCFQFMGFHAHLHLLFQGAVAFTVAF